MTDKEKKIMETCGAMVPKLSELEKEKFLSFTEGMAFLSSRQQLTTDARPESRT